MLEAGECLVAPNRDSGFRCGVRFPLADEMANAVATEEDCGEGHRNCQIVVELRFHRVRGRDEWAGVEMRRAGAGWSSQWQMA